MAATMGLALAAGPESDLERVAYSARPLNRAPEDRALGAVIRQLDRDWQPRLARRLARVVRCSLDDAEEAIDQELLLMIEQRREAFSEGTDYWLRQLFVRGRYRVLKNRSGPFVTSTDAIEEVSGYTGLGKADRCVPESPQAEEDALSLSLPGPREEWSRSQVIAALQRFHRYYGWPPRTRDCSAVNRLPSVATIRRYFGGFDAALVAAGIRPREQGRRRLPWTALEAAHACRSFYRRNNYWPSASDRWRDPSLPCRSVMLKYFGSTHGSEIREIAEAILQAAE